MRNWTKKSAGESAWRLAAGLALVIALSLGFVGRAGAQPEASDDPAALAAAFESAVGADAAAAVGMMSDDATLKIVPAPQGTSGVWTGKEELNAALQYSKEHLVKRQIVGTPQVQGNKVTYTALVSNDVFERLGVAPVQFSTEVVVEGGKIKSYTSVIMPAEQSRVAAAVAKAQGAAAGQAPPAGMPQTGSGGGDFAVAALALAAVLCLSLGAVMSGARKREDRGRV